MLTPTGTKARDQMTGAVGFWLWMLVKLPAALFCGVRLKEVGEERCVTTVPYGWRSQNPFKSTYFAAQAMAAEMSTGALVLLATADMEVPFSTLIVDMKATFGKKATGLATFTCEGGPATWAAVREAKATGEARVIALDTVGRLADGTEVSRFTFTWSVKPKSSR
jgi:hypothetical protein